MAEEVIGLLFGVDGGGSIDGRSGQQIVSDLTKIVNQINSGKSTVPKVQLKFDTSHAKTALQELRSQLQEIAGMGNISVSGMSSRGGSGGSAGVKQDAENYRALTATVKQYYAALAEVEKIQMKSTAVSSSGGVWSTTDAQYDARIQKVNQLKMEFDKLGISVNEAGMVEMNSAQQLNITEEQRAMLLTQVQSSITANGIAHEKSAAQISATWDKNAAKVHEYILRMQDVASKNSEVNALMTELNTLASSGNPQNLDELTAKFAQLQQKVRETNADVQTFGQKLSKTFGSQLRYMLTSMVYMKALQFLRDLYTNVVELDKAMTDLQIASGKTRAEIKELTKGYADLAKQLGATTQEVAESADTWLRQGYAAEETNTLIKNSTMLSKLGQMEAAEASKALTSAMKGYKVEVEDSIGIVDKFTAVDMEAAASAGDIATAMAETATSADIAGVSMDRLIGYLAVVKEVTQDGAESVGTFYRTLFARMNNVAAGKFVDDETGEALNDVETVLNELGIALRDTNGLFRDSGEVLDEVAGRWNSFDNTAQHAIATAFAGTRQQEKFIVLMENYGTAIKYSETAANSAGTALEKYSAYTESIDGKMNSLKASFEELSMTILNSELITGAIEFVTWLLEALTAITDAIGGLNTVLYVTVALFAIIKADSIVTFIMSIGAAITKLISFIASLIASIKIAKAEGITMGQFIKNAFYQITAGATTAQIAVAAFVAVISVAIIIVNSYNQSVQESIQNSLTAAEAANREAEAHQKNAKSLKELIDEYKELADNSGGAFDEKAATQVKTIQDKITELVGAQADNLDLVNGKLDDEIKKLIEIAELQGSSAKDKAIEQMADAENAYRDKVGAFDWGASDAYRIYGTGGLVPLWGLYDPDDSKNHLGDVVDKYTKEYGVMLQQHNDSTGDLLSMNRDYYFALQSDFENMEDFIAQYERIAAMKTALANAGQSDSYLYETAGEFLSDFKSIYDSYKSGALLIEEIENTQKEIEDIVNGGSNEGFTGVSVALKSSLTILEEVQDGYDGIASALTDVTSEGYLTAGALETLFKLEENNSLAGLKLANILTRDANGYKLAGDALQQYVQALIEAYTVEGAFATQKDKENAIANLQTLQAVLATLAATQNESTDASKARREELEKEQDMYQEQLDKFEELIDLRKDLLRTYQEELDYQKELEKRQRNVTALQTRLSVARLDQSAAGQARVRQLEAELKEAQEDLDDFTLEHAIDVLTDQLDSANAEWKAIIQGKLDEITALLAALDTTPEVNITTDTSWVQGAISQIEGLITDAHNKEVVDNSGSGGTTTGGGGSTQATYDQWSAAWYAANPGVYGPPPPVPSGWSVGDPVPGASKTRWTSYQDAADAGYANIRTRNEFARGGDDKNKYGTYQAYLDAMYQKYMGKAPVYHSGGFVGEMSVLSSNEEFAKLLKGEFVSTPAQMKRFMEETLPQIANYSATGGSNEFNAPLIEIKCESVTTEALPELERVVNDAVREIKKQLDSGMSRTGFKRTPTRRLT